MIAARWWVAIFFLPFCGGGFWVGDFVEHSEQLGFFLGGGFWEHSEHSEHSDDFSGGWWVFWIVSVGKN